jgi:hypothetical protein
MINRDTIRELRPLCISLEPALKKSISGGKTASVALSCAGRETPPKALATLDVPLSA